MARDRNGQFPLVKRIVELPARRYPHATMLNDQSSILSLLESRRSGKPRELVGPGPSVGELERILWDEEPEIWLCYTVAIYGVSDRLRASTPRRGAGRQ